MQLSSPNAGTSGQAVKSNPKWGFYLIKTRTPATPLHRAEKVDLSGAQVAQSAAIKRRSRCGSLLGI